MFREADPFGMRDKRSNRQRFRLFKQGPGILPDAPLEVAHDIPDVVEVLRANHAAPVRVHEQTQMAVSQSKQENDDFRIMRR